MKASRASILIFACLYFLALPACTQDATGRGNFTIAYSYDTSGQLEPCGCSAQQLGGLARRANLINALRQSGEVLAIEGGHIFEEDGRFPLFKAMILIKALNIMDYDGLMLGAREARQGISGIEQLADIAGFPLFSANLIVAGEPWQKRVVVLEKAGNRVAVTGISQPQTSTHEFPHGTRFSPPVAALSEVLDSLQTEAEVVVVCLEGDSAWVGDMIKEFADRVDLFLSGDRSLDAHALAEAAAEEAPQIAGEWELPNLAYQKNPAWLNNWGLGRYLGVIEVQTRGSRYALNGENRGIENSLQPDERIRDVFEADYKPHLREFFAEFADELAQDYIAAEKCAGCHDEEYEVFIATAHSHSLATLDEAGRTYDPDCMKCHVVYSQADDALHGMNCILCHSNVTFQHEWQAQEGMVIIPDVPPAKYTYEFCAKCHDPANSIPFEKHWPQYANLMYHGGNLSEAREASKTLGIEISDPPPDLTSTTLMDGQE